jgi:glycosyltransferase involved in cell wall biosynthesis
MRVLVLTDYFLPHACGGIERAVYEVSRRVAAEGHDVTVLTFRRGDAAAEEEMDCLHVLRAPAVDVSDKIGIQLSGSAHVWPQLWKMLRGRDFDVVHTHGLFFHVSLAGAAVARLRGKPLVTTAHVGSLAEIGGVASHLSAVYEQSVGRFILASSRRVICVSNAVAQHVATLGASSERVNVIPNGVDLTHYSPGDETGEMRAPRIVFVGRLIGNKGPQHLVEALPAIAKQVPHVECWIVGDGPMRSQLQARVQEMRLEANVTFLGERDDVADLLRQCDLFVRPSLSEGMPLAVLEAMASGLPVVVTPVGGTPEVIQDGENGYLVEPGDGAALAAKVNELLTRPEQRSAMAAEARRTAATYSWDAVAKQTIDVYASALGKEEAAWLQAA